MMESKVIRGLVTNATQDRILMQAGIVQDGDLLFSQMPSSCNQLNDYDRIILLEVDTGEPFFGERIRRGTGDKDTLSYNARRVQFVTQTDPNTGVTTRYDENTDFNIMGRVLNWVGPHRPPSGSTYGIQYTANYEYTVVMPPFIRYEGETNLGQRAVLKLRNIQGDDNASHIQEVRSESVGDSEVRPAGESGEHSQGSMDTKGS